MSVDLVTRNVFVDTSIFIGENFHVDGGAFQALVALCQADSAHLIITDITRNEVDANLVKRVDSAQACVREFRSKARVLRNLGWASLSGIFENFDHDDAVDQLRAKISEFVEHTGAEVLAATQADPKPVFEAYFSAQPPFGSGTKKAEFPDAFIIQALSAWCEDSGEEVYVVSKDGDLKAACATFKHLHILGSLSEFIELVLADEGLLVEFAHNLLERNRSEIQRAISSEFEDTWMYLEDEDGDVDSTSVGELTLSGESVISTNLSKAVFSAEAAVSFSADISYNDKNSSYYDSEDRQVHYLSTIETMVDRDLEVPVQFCLHFDAYDHDPEKYSIKEIEINRGAGLSIYADEDAATFYK